MNNYSPIGYICPFCLLVQGIKNEFVYSVQSDIIFQDSYITAFVSSHQYPKNLGNVIVIPNSHIENIYDLSSNYAKPIFYVVKAVAIAMKTALRCDGISIRQNNEPAGNQDVWHYHVHILPRYYNDQLYSLERVLVSEADREEFANKIRLELSINNNHVDLIL